jgi:hypothetical protein
MIVRTLLAALLLTATTVRAQNVQTVPAKPLATAAPTTTSYFENQHEEVSGSGAYGSFKIIYDRDSARRTQLRFNAPEPMSVRVLDGSQEVLRDTIPTKFDAKPGRRYRVQISNGKDVVFDQVIEAKEEMIGQLQATLVAKPVTILTPTPPPPPPVPTRPSPVYPPASGKVECMNAKVATAFTDNVREAPSPEDKLWYVRDLTKRKSYYFCVSQVFTTLKLLPTSKEQLDALKEIAPLIVDRQNEFKIPQLFKTDNERDEVRRILAQAR